MTAATTANSARAIEEVAALWLIRREDVEWTAEAEAELAAWLDESMAHKAAFWRLEHGWSEADRIGSLGLDPLTARRDFARSGWLRRALTMRPRWLVGVGGAAAAIAITFAGIETGRLPTPGRPSTPSVASAKLAVYRTSVGGNRMVRLADGSHIQLNTSTRIRAADAPDGREVWLDKGEAFFDVVHRTDRQFVVHAGPHTITVLGTRFTVRRDGDRITVAVLSGRVRIDGAETPAAIPRTALVSTGNVALVERHATLVSTTGEANIDALTAWREQMIVFDDKPLSEVVREFNRYNTDAIRIADPALAKVRVGGTFKTSDRESFVNLLRIAYGIRVRRNGRDVVLGD